MSLLSELFRKKSPRLEKPIGEPKTSNELIAEVTEGANLVEGKQTWKYAEEKKHDIEYMIKCCHAELKTMEKAGLVPAPYYFEVRSASKADSGNDKLAVVIVQQRKGGD